MWLFTRGRQNECESVRDVLERATSGENREDVALGTLLARLPEGDRQHVGDCTDCRMFADELLEVRGMFGHEQTGAQPGPYFLSRVMAAISEREAELEGSTQTWAAVPRLASRLAVLASLTLLIAGSWLYQQPRHTTTVAGISAEQNSEGLVEGSSNALQDDMLLSSPGR